MTAAAPEISIVIPTHGGRFLAATVASVRAQTLPGWELVIVDDGSRDGTAAVAAGLAAADARIRVVTHAHNRGIAAARNTGLAATTRTSRYVAFLDHDDLWTPDTLAVLRAALDARATTCAAAHGMADCIDDGGRTVPRPDVARAQQTRYGVDGGRIAVWAADRPTELANLAYRNCVVSVGSGLIHRASLDRVGGFDARAVPADDYDMWLRLSRLGGLAFVPRVVLRYRLHDARTSLRPRPPRGQGTPYIHYKLATAAENTPAQRRLVTTAFRAYQRDLLRQRWAALVAAARRRDPATALRELTAVGIRAVGLARGRPWSWHR
jgi:glycosyltransferase involved in cell wall biosynthesis